MLKFRLFLFFTISLLFSGILLSRAQTNMPESKPYDNDARYRDSIEIGVLLKQYDSVKLIDKALTHKILLNIYYKAKRADLPKALFIALVELGAEASKQGAYRHALNIHKQALYYTQKGDNKKYIDIVYASMGLTYSSLGKYDTALNYFYKALASLKDLGPRDNKTDSSNVYNDIGIAWGLLGEVSYAINNFREGEKIAAKNKDTNMLGMLQQNIAGMYLKKDDLPMAEGYYKKTLAISGNGKYRYQRMATYIGLATICDKKKDFISALNYLNQAQAIATSSNLPVYANVSIYATYGAVYLHMKDYAKARPLLTDAYEQAKAMQNGELIESMEPDLAELYAATGEFEKAYRHQKNYADIKDSLFNNERSRSIEVLMNTKVAEKDKAVLTQKLHIAQQKGQLQKKNIWIGGSLLISLLLISLSFALIRNFRHNQKLQQSQINQLSQKQEINQLKAQVRGEEQERQRIARELHDGIASQLWAIKLNVESIQQNRKNKTEGNSNLTPVFQQLNDVTVDVRKTAHNLMPDLLLKEGLAAAVRSLCEKTDRNTKLDVHFQAFGALPKIDKEVELSIYRMVQELIQNVLKHAMDASNLLVQLSYVNTLLSITVEDNGKVVSNTQNIDGVGLQQIRKRTEAFKGHFDLQSISGKGTTAYLEFDLKHWI